MAEAAEKKEAASSEAPPTKAKRDILSFLTLLLAVATLGTVGGIAYLGQKMWERVQGVESQVTRLQAPEEEAHEENIGKELEPESVGILYPLEGFLVNIHSDQGPKFLQAQMELELAESGLEEEISRKKAAIRDAVIVLLSSRSYAELRERDGMVKLRQDLLRAINDLLTGGKVKELYFTQFHFN